MCHVSFVTSSSCFFPLRLPPPSSPIYPSILSTDQSFNLSLQILHQCSRLDGVTDPEIKRKTIGNLFIEVFQEEALVIGKVDYLLQGTLYPDVIESISYKGRYTASQLVQSNQIVQSNGPVKLLHQTVLSNEYIANKFPVQEYHFSTTFPTIFSTTNPSSQS